VVPGQVKGDGVEHKLAFDHKAILARAISRLRNKAEYTSLPAYLLPDTFTLGELQHAYSVVLGRPMDKSGFRTRALSAGLVELTDGMKTGHSRPAQLYRLKTPKNPIFFPRTSTQESEIPDSRAFKNQAMGTLRVAPRS